MLYFKIKNILQVNAKVIWKPFPINVNRSTL